MKRNTLRVLLSLIGASVIGLSANAASSADYEISAMVLDGAGGMATSVDYDGLSSTAQGDAFGQATSTDYEAVFGFVGAVYALAGGPIEITVPNGGEEWACGLTYTIAWESDSPDVGTDVRVGLHKGATFIDWIVRRTENDGAYNWIVWTDLVPDDDYTIRVQSFDNADLKDYSDGPFTIIPLGVLTPNGDETWTMGDVEVIEWRGNDSVVGANVRVGLHYGVDFVDWINRSTANDGMYFWMIPADLTPGYGYRIRVQSYDDNTIRDLSDTPFTLELPPLLWTSPGLNDELAMGGTYEVTWNCNDMGAVGPDVRIGLHKGGAFIDWMIRKTPNDNAFFWTVPTGLTPASSYRLRLQSYTDSSVRTMSPAFAILAAP